MKNNLFKLTVLWMVGFALASCQHDVDVFGLSTNLALKNMPGYYTLTVVDSATMIVTKTECNLEKQVNGVGKGYYRVSVSGMCAPSDDQKPITWDAVMSEDKLSMITTLTFEDGNTKVFKWRDGVLHLEDGTYDKTGASNISALNTAYEQLENKEFEVSKKTYFAHLDTVYFLAWKTQVDFWKPEDTASMKAQYLAELQPYLDTIKWYIQNVRPVGDVQYDTVSGQLINLVVVDPVASSRGSNKGKHGVTHVVKEDTLQHQVLQINDRPEEIELGTLAFNRVGDANSGVYTYRKQTWTEECYTDPTSPKAQTTDSSYTMQPAVWAITSITSNKKFDVLFKGTENGTKEGAFSTVNISDFDADKGELVVGTLKYKLKQ